MTNGESISVLLVDDEPAIREVFTHFLEGRGHKVVSAGSASAALKSAQNVEFDVIILDNLLPDIVGLDLVEDLRRRAPDSKIILLTGALVDDVEARAHALKVHCCLQKPIRASALIDVVEAAGILPPSSSNRSP